MDKSIPLTLDAHLAGSQIARCLHCEPDKNLTKQWIKDFLRDLREAEWQAVREFVAAVEREEANVVKEPQP